MRLTISLITFLAFLGMSKVALHAQDDEPGRYELPPAHDFSQPPTSPADIPNLFHGLPLSLDGIGVACVGSRKVINIPVLMNEPDLPIDIKAVTLDPMNWHKREVFSKKLGRRSLYFVEPGTTMLYSVIIDPADLQGQNIGVGLVVVKRVNEKTYEVLIESNNGDVLAAARGELQVLDPSIGMGTLKAIGNQEEIRKKYGARWDLDPNEHCYPMFSR